MFVEENYLKPDEPCAISAAHHGCIWAGCLYERKSGGFDLFYDHGNSEFKPIGLDTITKLRHLCAADGGVFLITHLDGWKIDKKIIEEAQRLLLAWVLRTLEN
jgi:hypothetical protein